jgi:hypothetical protein
LIPAQPFFWTDSTSWPANERASRQSRFSSSRMRIKPQQSACQRGRTPAKRLPAHASLSKSRRRNHQSTLRPRDDRTNFAPAPSSHETPAPALHVRVGGNDRGKPVIAHQGSLARPRRKTSSHQFGRARSRLERFGDGPRGGNWGPSQLFIYKRKSSALVISRTFKRRSDKSSQ